MLAGETKTPPGLGLFLAQGYGFACIGLVFLLLARVLGPTGFGTFATLYAAAVVVGTILHASLGQVSLAHGGRTTHGAWFSSTIRMGELLSLLGIPVGALAGLAIWHQGLVPSAALAALALAVLVPLSMWDYFAYQFLSTAGDVDNLIRVVVVGRTATAALAVLGSQFGPGVALAGISLGMAVGLAMALRGLRRYRKLQGTSQQMAGSPLQAGLLLHSSALASIIIAQGPILVLARLLGPIEAGQYSLAFQFISAFLVLPMAQAAILTGRIAADGPQRTWARHVRTTVTVSLVVLVLAALAWLASPWFQLLLGGDHVLAVALFRGLLPALVGWPFAIMMAPQWIARGFLWQSSLLTVVLAATSVGLAVALVPSEGALGAAWATSATFAIALLMNVGLAAVAVRTPVRQPP